MNSIFFESGHTGDFTNSEHPSKSYSEVSSRCEIATQYPEETLYIFAHSKELGQYIIANKHIQPGQVIIEDVPLVVGPWTEYDFTCIGCYVPLPTDHKYKCKNCDWTLCGPKCTGLKKVHGHTDTECNILRKHRTAASFSGIQCNERRHLYEALFPLRCLLLSETDPEKWKKLCSMESHNDRRRLVPNLWKRNQEVIVNRIRKDWKFGHFSESDIHTVCGFIEVNCYEVGYQKGRGRALYYGACSLLHDCRSNTTHSTFNEGLNIEVRSTVFIKKGDPITLCYGYLLQSTFRRRQFLHDAKFFWCTCERCADPTEFGTYLSALKCPKCPDGIVLPRDPLNSDSVWICCKCSYCLLGKLAHLLEDKLYEELTLIDNNNLEEMEQYLYRYRKALHKNHYLFLLIKFFLVQHYGKTNGKEKPTTLQLTKKEEYCRDLLEVLDKLDPGLSRIRGIVLYELHEPVMVRATRFFERDELTLVEFKKRIDETIDLLKQSLEILEYEPSDGPEHVLVIEARTILKEMNRIHRIISTL